MSPSWSLRASVVALLLVSLAGCDNNPNGPSAPSSPSTVALASNTNPGFKPAKKSMKRRRTPRANQAITAD